MREATATEFLEDLHTLDMASLLDSDSPLAPPPYTDSNKAKGKYKAHKDSDFNGGSVHFELLQHIDFPPSGRSSEDDEKAYKITPWMAYLDFYLKDMPAAMEQGLHWSQDNVDPTGSSYNDSMRAASACFREWGFTHMRKFQLIDLAEDPQWKGKLLVFARGIKGLAEFRIHHMSINNIIKANGSNGEPNKVYIYDRRNPDGNFNAIYDDMPLSGWWPWPKSPHS